MTWFSARSKFRFLLLTAGVLMLLFTALRLGFVLHFGGRPAFSEPGMWRALGLGFQFDVRLTFLMLLPPWLMWRTGQRGMPRPWIGALLVWMGLALYVVLVVIAMVDTEAAKKWLLAFLVTVGLLRFAFPSVGVETHRAIRWAWLTYGAGTLAFVLLAYIVDFGAYAYIHTRLNGTLLMFMENAGTSLKVVWQSYPIVWLALAFLAALAGLLWWLGHTLRDGTPFPGRPGVSAAFHVGVSVLVVMLMWGKWSQYPLRWSQVFEKATAFQAHTALNPVLFFLETRRDMDGGYDLKAVEASHAVMAEYFGIPVSRNSQGLPTLERTLHARPQVPATANIVFIQLESFAGFKTGILGNTANATPFFDSLCRQGLFFDRFYVVMENTSRSMFATLFGTPDVSSVESAVRNPMLLDQHSVLDVLQDRTKLFTLGGSANWAQIRGILTNNFRDLNIREAGHWKSPSIDVWGICDRDLLVETSDLLTTQTQPFWAYVQTSGNHPPFTVPAHVKDFVPSTMDPAFVKTHGFTGREEYESLRFMDHGLQTFFAHAQQQPWFRNTMFVLFADHGIPRGNTDPRFGELTLSIHHVPFLIYAPGLGLQPRRVSTVGSQMDILPTVVSLMGKTATTRTLGKDLLDPAYLDKGAAFTFTTFRRPPVIGLIDRDWYVNLEPDGRVMLYRLDDPSSRNRASEDPGRAQRMAALCRGFHAWSRFLLSHNKR